MREQHRDDARQQALQLLLLLLLLLLMLLLLHSSFVCVCAVDYVVGVVVGVWCNGKIVCCAFVKNPNAYIWTFWGCKIEARKS